VACSLFDHKAITLDFVRPAVKSKLKITNYKLNDQLLQLTVKLTAYKCHLFILDRTSEVAQETFNVCNDLLTRISDLHVETWRLKREDASRGGTRLGDHTIAGKITEIKMIWDESCPLTVLESLPKTAVMRSFS
jgi:hypothetical protein